MFESINHDIMKANFHHIHRFFLILLSFSQKKKKCTKTDKQATTFPHLPLLQTIHTLQIPYYRHIHYITIDLSSPDTFMAQQLLYGCYISTII